MKEMKRKNEVLIFIYAATLGLLIGGCNKIELPPPVEEDPVFSLELDWADGTGLDLVAGEDRYFLFTGFEADSLNVFELSGRFAQLDCLDQCEPSFAIYFRNDTATQGNDPGEPVFLQGGQNMLFKSEQSIAYDTLVQYAYDFLSTSQLCGPQIVYTWTIDDTLTLTSPLPELELDRVSDQPFDVCLQLVGPSGSLASQCQQVRLDSTAHFAALIESDTNGMSLTAIPSGGLAPFSYSWDNGVTGPFNQFVQPGGSYCVTITDATGLESSNCIQTPQNPVGGPLCIASFEYQSAEETEIIPISGDSLQLKTVILEYVEDGVVYRSDRISQPAGAFFTIDGVEPYEPNENGRPTLLIRARFSGLLVSEGGVEKEVAEARVVFAIAY
jgi:hypothetical protein